MPSGVYQHKKLTEEHKNNISQSLKGHLVNNETKLKIGLANKGIIDEWANETGIKVYNKEIIDLKKRIELEINGLEIRNWDCSNKECYVVNSDREFCKGCKFPASKSYDNEKLEELKKRLLEDKNV